MATWVVPSGVPPDDIWEHMKNSNVIRFRCVEMGDLSNTSSAERRKKYEKVYVGQLGGIKGDLEAFDYIIEKMRKDDYVLARRGRTLLLGIGRVNDVGYYFDDALNDYNHCRGVNWIYTDDMGVSLPLSFTKFTPYPPIYKYKYNIEKLFNIFTE